jgi:hypothetical protein
MRRLLPTRRQSIGVFAVCGSAQLWSKLLGAWAGASAHAEEADTDKKRIRLVISAVDEDRVRDIVAGSGGQTDPGHNKYDPNPSEQGTSTDPNFAPLIVIVAVMVVGYLAKTIVNLWQQVHYGGLVIDARGNDIVVKENQALPGGVVVIITADNKVQEFTPKDESELGKILKTTLTAK